MITENSIEHSYLAGRDMNRIKNFEVEAYDELKNIGINLDELINSMDAVQGNVTTPSIATPVQFLQNWLPGFVFVITAARKIDQIIGISTIGSWEDEQIVQGEMEQSGTPVPYGDKTNIPYSNWNVNWTTRTVVRFEEGLFVSKLESARSARINVDSGATKRGAAANALEIERNAIGFYGYNSGDNNTYGLLNDPGLPGYTTVATGVAGLTWKVKTFLEIQRDLLTAISTLRNQSLDQIDPEDIDITLTISTDSVDYLATTSDFGISVREWLRVAYPRIRVTSAPEFNAANGGASVFYLFADVINDMSTDDGRSIIQVVPAKYMTLGVEQEVKGYKEGYTNATAGVMVKRPWAFVRKTGIGP